MTSWWYAPHLGADDPAERDTRELIAVADDDEVTPFGFSAGYFRDAPSANLQGSPNGDGTHSIVLDLDCPHEYRDSSTPGHGHLIVPARLSRRQYRRLLKMLCKAGAITPSYLGHASRRQWATFVRAPGVYKADGEAQS
jgi:hypothetical protein